MSNIKNFYPIFEENQVLTASQLNNLSEFLFQQSRLTRARLIGSGIACGFEITEKTDDNIRLSKGIGVTSEGYLIDLPECNLTNYRTFTPASPYKPFNAEPDLDILELISEEEAASLTTTSTPLNQLTTIADYAVVLFIDCNDLDNSACLGEACDEIGKSRLLTVRKLLIKTADIDGPIKANVLSDCSGGTVNGTTIQDLLTPYPIARPVIRQGEIDGSSSSRYVQFSKKYTEAIADSTSAPGTRGFAGLAVKLKETYNAYSTVLEPIYGSNPFDNLNTKITSIEEFIASADGNASSGSDLTGFGFFGAQYLYDAVKELTLAYNEFIGVACQVEGICCACLGRFPKHLYVGLANVLTKENTSLNYRHRWIASPVTNGQDILTKQMVQLHKRLVLMFEKLNLNAINAPSGYQVKWTPSFEKKGILQDRSIPFYYDIEDASTFGIGNLKDAWKAHVDKDCVGLVKPTISYDDNNVDATAPTTPQSTPLHYSLDASNFFRSGGHLGKDAEGLDSAGARFNEISENHNLPAKLITLQLEDPDSIDAIKDLCNFNDLNTAYLTLRENLKWQTLQTTFALRYANNIGSSGRPDFDEFGDEVTRIGGGGAERRGSSGRPYGGNFNISISSFNFPTPIDEAYPSQFVNNYLLDNAAGEGNIRDTFTAVEEAMTDLYNFLDVLDFKDFEFGLDATGTVTSGAFFALYNAAMIKLMDAKVRIDLQIVKRTTLTSDSNATKAIAIFEELLRAIDRLLLASFAQEMSALDALKQFRLNYIKDNNPRVLENFIKIHPGIIHGAGTVMGGTFIQLTPGTTVTDPANGGTTLGENTVIGDFYLPYVCCANVCSDIPCPTNSELSLPLIVGPQYIRLDESIITLEVPASGTKALSGSNTWFTIVPDPDLTYDRSRYSPSDIILVLHYNTAQQQDEVLMDGIITRNVCPAPVPTGNGGSVTLNCALRAGSPMEIFYQPGASNTTDSFGLSFYIQTNDGKLQSNIGICNITLDRNQDPWETQR